MCIFKALTDLCATEQQIRTENGFVSVVCSVLVAKEFSKSIKKSV